MDAGRSEGSHWSTISGRQVLALVAVGLLSVTAACDSDADTVAESTIDVAPESTSDIAPESTTRESTAVSTSTVSTTSTTQPGPTTTAFFGPTRELELRLYRFPTILLTAPTEWDNFNEYGIRRGAPAATGDWIGIVAAAPGLVYQDPCNWKGASSDAGRSVDDVVAALTAQQLRNPTEPVPVTVAGYDGMYFEWSVPPDQDFQICDNGSFRAWLGAAGPNDRLYVGPGQYERVWVLDVGEERPLVLLATYWPSNDEAARTESDKILASLTLAY